jgi:hypothetical protein
MSTSVQGWRTKWFYIKDRKASSEDEYGLAPFDASKELKKLASGDSPPTDAEMKEVAPLLDHIQALKGGRGGALSGMQLMAFFVQRRVQPLQHRLSKLWSYSGLVDSSRVSRNLIEKQDVDKRVRNLTKLTKDHAVADLAAHYFDSTRGMFSLGSQLSCFPSSFCCQLACLDDFTDLLLLQGHQFLASRLPLPEEGPLPVDLGSAVSEAPEAEENQDSDDVEILEDETSSTTSPPPMLSEDLVVNKKRKCVEELAASSISVQRTAVGATLVQEDDLDLFDYMAS